MRGNVIVGTAKQQELVVDHKEADQPEDGKSSACQKGKAVIVMA